MGKSVQDLTGQRFGRLVAIEHVGFTKGRSAVWLWQCDCGNKVECSAGHVKEGSTISCGCYNKERSKEVNTKHGLHGHPLYKVWREMNRRCSNKKDKRYDRYGGRGIFVCDEWNCLNEDGLNNFIRDMYPSYAEDLSIDRINNDKGYFPENCRWATDYEQARNKGKRKNTSSKYIGVSFKKPNKKWQASIRYQDKPHYIGLFVNEEDAAKAYDNVCEQFYGNRPNGT